MVVIPASIQIMVMSMHRHSGERGKVDSGPFRTVRMMIQDDVKTHHKGACPGGEPEGQDQGGEEPPTDTVHREE